MISDGWIYVIFFFTFELLYHSFNTIILYIYLIVRSCWGPEARHTETVAWFLDNGVPLDELYDTCMEMTNNAGTKELLNKRKSGDEL